MTKLTITAPTPKATIAASQDNQPMASVRAATVMIAIDPPPPNIGNSDIPHVEAGIHPAFASSLHFLQR
jgi:hypothetical protein